MHYFSAIRWKIHRLMRRVGVRVTAYALLGAITALAGYFLKFALPADLSAKIGAESVDSLLQILVSSMLTVTTFSLSILTAAYAAAGSNSTPRAVSLLVEDSTSQNVLATFLGAFMFSLISVIMLKTGIYGDSGRVVLFGVTVAVILIVVISLLRWIDALGALGRVDDTINRVADSAIEALDAQLQDPFMGGHPLYAAPPADALPIRGDQVGYVQHIDADTLQNLAEQHALEIYLDVRSGDRIEPGRVLMHVTDIPGPAKKRDQLSKGLCACLSIESNRSFEQDPRFGIQTLSEIAQRALSPGVNDPGTARAVVTKLLQVLSHYSHPVTPELRLDRVWVRPLSVADLLQEAFLQPGIDGAGNYFVQRDIQSGLQSLAQLSPVVFAVDAARISQHLLGVSDKATVLSHCRDELHVIADELQRLAKSWSDADVNVKTGI